MPGAGCLRAECGWVQADCWLTAGQVQVVYGLNVAGCRLTADRLQAGCWLTAGQVQVVYGLNVAGCRLAAGTVYSLCTKICKNLWLKAG